MDKMKRMSMEDELFALGQVERSSPFWLNILFLRLAGLWPPCSRFWKYVYHVLRLLGFSFSVWLLDGEIGAIVHYWGDLDRLTLLISVVSAASCAVIKAVIFDRRFTDIRHLVLSTSSLIQSQKQSSQNKNVIEILQKSQNYAWKISMILTLVGAVVMMMWDILPVVQKILDSSSENLPINIWLPYNSTAVHGYGTTYIFQVLALYAIGQVLMSIDVLLFTIMILITAQLEILCLNLSNLRISSKDDILTMSNNTELIEQKGHASNNKSARLKTFQTKCNEYLTLCRLVKHHQDIIRIVENTEDVMNSIVLPQFVADLLMACLSLYQSMETNNMNVVFTNFALLLAVIFHLFLYCWHAELMVQQSQQVTLAAYKGNWVDSSQIFKKCLLTVMARSQKPLILTYGKFSAISKASFLAVLNAAYSYYAILSHINKHKNVVH